MSGTLATNSKRLKRKVCLFFNLFLVVDGLFLAGFDLSASFGGVGFGVNELELLDAYLGVNRCSFKLFMA